MSQRTEFFLARGSGSSDESFESTNEWRSPSSSVRSGKKRLESILECLQHAERERASDVSLALARLEPVSANKELHALAVPSSRAEESLVKWGGEDGLK